nr:GGDEF domain-containing protein [Oleiagrimonas soli]
MLVAVAVTALQVRAIYRNQVTAARAQLDEIQQSLLPSLEASLWQVDDGSTRLLLNALIHTPGIGYVQLDSEGRRLTRGKADVSALVERSYPLTHDDGQRFDLGTLRVVIDDRIAMARMHNAIVRELLTTIAAMLSMSVLLLLLFRRQVTRRLQIMADYASTLDFERLHTPLKLAQDRPHKRPDELDQVAQALDQMRVRMLDNLAVRVRHENELTLHRERLESLVQARTAALEEKTRQLEEKSRELEMLANTDGLTGVFSRRHFFTLFEQELARARRGGATMTVLMLDVDHFKHINDTYGHAAGDRVLVRIAETCRRELRRIDTLGRLGGEEFAALLPRSNRAAAAVTAERLRSVIAALSVDSEQGEAIRFTVSIGVAELTHPDESADALIERADAQLYRAKRNGRNRVCVDETPSTD